MRKETYIFPEMSVHDGLMQDLMVVAGTGDGHSYTPPDNGEEPPDEDPNAAPWRYGDSFWEERESEAIKDDSLW